MTFTQKAVEAAARAICCKAHKLGCTAQHDASPFTACQAHTYRDDAINALEAALAVDGVCLVDAMDVLPSFKVGDRVAHSSRQENGTVTAIENGCVVVEFDRPAPKGQKSVGKYDAAWFRMYPRGLIAAANDGEERR
jgi:hypothetical protein